jgi:hypothetical protein
MGIPGVYHEWGLQPWHQAAPSIWGGLAHSFPNGNWMDATRGLHELGDFTVHYRLHGTELRGA